jgi:pimeloyl-ACP methyl ester carboxylesterase
MTPRSTGSPHDSLGGVVGDHLRVNDIRLHYLRAGHGPRTVVLTHGHSHCAGVWLPLIHSLAGAEFTVVAVDMRGHGGSDKPDSGYDYATLRDDLVAMVVALGLRHVLYVGHSRGGSVSLLAAASTRDRADGVLVYEPTIPFQRGPSGRPTPIEPTSPVTSTGVSARPRREVFTDRQTLAHRYRNSDAFRRWRQDYFDAFVSHGTSPRIDGSVELCMPSRVVQRLRETMHGFEPWASVDGSGLPTMAVFGDSSGRLNGERDPIAALRTIFPVLETRIMAGATHNGPMEQPDVFEHIVRDFAVRIARYGQSERDGQSTTSMRST